MFLQGQSVPKTCRHSAPHAVRAVRVDLAIARLGRRETRMRVSKKIGTKNSNAPPEAMGVVA